MGVKEQAIAKSLVSCEGGSILEVCDEQRFFPQGTQADRTSQCRLF